MQVVEVSVGKLNPSAYNPRVISDEDMDSLKRAMEEFGCVEPLVVNKDFSVIGGHQRLVAAKDLGWKKVPVVMVDLPQDKAMALNLALNRIHGDWDFGKLRDVLEEIDTGAFDIELTGFGPEEIENIMTWVPEEEVQEEVPVDLVTPEKPKSKRGEIYELGPHRLMCGDSTEKKDVELLLTGFNPTLIIADPPYGINLDTDYSKMTSSRSMGKAKKYRKIEGDDVRFDASKVVLPSCDEQFWFGADYYISTLENIGGMGSWLVWDKRLDESADDIFGSCFELIWSFNRHKRWILRYKWAGFFTGGEERQYDHPTTKPVALMLRLIDLAGGNGHLYDPFGGSGTSIIAADQHNLMCYAMEIDRGYCDVIRRRYAEHVDAPELIP